ncbi:MAG: CoA ester lyase [Marinosulfonomonas sp.]|nr:MAG: CoA ester lyase [Marinosulfonomonas sp.]
MALNFRPYRSVLYIPGSNTRALEKARNLPVDAIIFDLEDAVTADEKTNARGVLVAELAAGGYGERACLVRVNGLETEWGNDDLAAFAGAAIDGILLPKMNSAADVDAIAGKVADVPLWAMIETPLGVLNSADIAAHPRIAGLVMGTNDLAKELGSRTVIDREPLLMSLQMALLGARAAGIVCVDGVFNAFKDTDGLRVECEQGRDLGFDGKTLIHPAQIEIANAVFAPSEAEVDLARRQIAAFEEARAQGKGVAVVDGQIVENLHIETARALLDKLDAINANRRD